MSKVENAAVVGWLVGWLVDQGTTGYWMEGWMKWGFVFPFHLVV